MRRIHFQFLVWLTVQLCLTTGIAGAAEKSLETIHEAWRNALKGVHTYGLALQDLDQDANACGLERMALADAVRSGFKGTPLDVNAGDVQLFNIFVDISTIHSADRCTSMVSLRVSAFVDPTYAKLIAAEITPWSQHTIVISSKENHPDAVAEELSKQASSFGNVWRQEQAR